MMKPRFRAEDEGEIAVSEVRVTDDVESLASCFGQPIIRNSVLDALRARRLAAIHLDTAEKVY